MKASCRNGTMDSTPVPGPPKRTTSQPIPEAKVDRMIERGFLSPVRHNPGVRVDDTSPEGQGFVAIEGELDVASVSSVAARIVAVDAPVVRVDTAKLTFIDSTGLAGL